MQHGVEATGDPSSMLALAIAAAREAGHLLREHYARPHDISSKGLRDIVTEADLAAERAAMQVIREGCPGARFVSEESFGEWQDYGDAPTWVIDPLDGTTNFARGLPEFSISVAMVRSNVVRCGVIYDPLLDHLFGAERGQGATLNGKPLRVSLREQLMESLVLLDWPRRAPYREMLGRFLARMVSHVDGVRSRGSAALGLCYVAAGWADAYLQFTLGPWDVAAGLLMVEEAGGQVTDLRGGPYALNKPDWLATNGLIHQAILDLHPYDS